MKDEKHYYTELHVTEFRGGRGFEGFDSCCAHFSTKAEVGTEEFKEAREDGIALYGGQHIAHGWKGYTIGKTYIQTGHEEVTCMSPAYYEGHRSFPKFEEVK